MGLVQQSNLHTENINYSAIVLTTSENMYLVVKEFLKHTKCSVTAQTASVQTALQHLHSGRANLLVIDDGNDTPSTAYVREITSDPIGLLTPMVVLLMDKNANETIHLSHLAKMKVTSKPLTPSTFPPSFAKLINLWSTNEMKEIREKTKLSLSASLADRNDMLQSLLKYPDTACLVARAIALNLHQMGKIKEAEAILLEYMRKNSHDVGLLTTLGHVYLMSAMPLIANKIFSKIHSKFNESTIAIPDLIQTHLILDEFEKTTELFRVLCKKNYMTSQTYRQLGRLLYASGRHKDASYALASQEGIYRQIEMKWKEILSEPIEKAS
ncbi:MAG: hypothetical protein WCI18_04165 [Pseudomonadota bacterium]